MSMKQLADGVWVLALGNANAVLLQDGSDLALFDAGFAGKARVVFDAIAALGRRPADLKHLVFTHGHPDHIGSAAAILRATGARTYMHAADAPLAETGTGFRPMMPARGLIRRLAFKVVWNPYERMAPFRIDQTIVDGETLPFMGGLKVIGTPGHAAGQVAFLCPKHSLLIGGDAFITILDVGDPIGFEDEAEGHRSQRKLAALDFDKAVFGHGGALTAEAAERIRRRLARQAVGVSGSAPRN